MKVLFYVQRLVTAKLTYALANYFKQRDETMQFAALAYRSLSEGEYLKETKLFEQVMSESEIHQQARQLEPDADVLGRLEHTYGIPTIWQFVTQNRFLTMKNLGYLYRYGSPYSREQLLTHIQHRFHCIEKLVDSFKPDVIIYPEVDVGPSSALILERIAKERGIKVVVPISSRIGSFHTFTNTVFSKADHIERLFYKYLSAPDYDRAPAQALWNSFKKDNLPLSYIDDELGINRKKTREQFLHGAIKERLNGHYFRSDDPFRLSLFTYDMATFIVKLRQSRLKLGKFFTNPTEGEKYVYYPLHFEPEIALILYAPFYTNQLAIIRNLAQSLPYDTCLYVKDHVVGRGRRMLSFYKDIAGIPNVKLLNPELDSRELIKGSEGVVTVTGTVGMEAILLKKPVITFGDVFYNMADELVWHTHSFEDLPHLIKRFKAFESNDETILAFLAAILAESIPIDPLVLARAVSNTDNPQELMSFTAYAEYLEKAIKSSVKASSEMAS